ncbi:MAG: hypothetical protein GF332_00480 [Candidatus Moranbacteria bacterium]|nr:hypothetical protein [Candidatus Moranbacteria bacterium]
MQLTVKTIPASRVVRIKRLNQSTYRVKLTQPPANNLANQQLIKIMAQYLNVPTYAIRIIKGQKSKIKIIHVSHD